MKKIVLSVLLFCFVFGFAAAIDDRGVGFTAGVDVSLGDVADDVVFKLIPNVEYANSFGAFDILAYLEYGIAFDDPDNVQNLYGELEGFYNLRISNPGLLTVGVYTEHDLHLAPDLGDDVRTYNLIIEPRAMYTHSFDFGDLFGRVGVPITPMHQGVLDDDDELGLGVNFRLGWQSTFGLGAHVTANMDFKPDSEYTGTDLLISYEMEDFGLYAEVEFSANKDFDIFSITPKVEYHITNMFWVWGEVEFSGLGDEAVVVPTLGVKASF
ncbi:hypothetical protein [Breznakiella homolactica]|uniref:Transporter n=1 Tax=Breznakiella homolactica TaxID=2798577 RepID=A0A7T7XKB8_9SPIR|nr:hypothetical protein [Breznakiella homolactica]QQO07885.1 hypothetical protein JFL75_13160 [Breznakiella homolactica]